MSDNDRVLLRGVTTGILDSCVTLAFVLIVMWRDMHQENINPAYPECPEFSPGNPGNLMVISGIFFLYISYEGLPGNRV
jgi:hypothetical protein